MIILQKTGLAMKEAMDFLRSSDLPACPNFSLGPLLVSPSRRVIEGPGGVCPLEPQVTLVFLCLAERPGQVVTRRTLLERCWGGIPVGEDSLNRTIAGIRRMLTAVADGAVTLETVPRTGYRIVVSKDAIEPVDRRRASESAVDCWRAGLPRPDLPEISALTRALDTDGTDARDWGILALLLRKAVEYADADGCAEYVRQCERAARTALALDPEEPNARVALAGVSPLFGNWISARLDLLAVLEKTPDHPPGLHDLAVVEMATGRPRAAVPIIERLIAHDRLAPLFHYKRLYHLWTLGDLAGAEQAAARAIALWPKHPAVWMARFWFLLFTDRPDRAVQLACDEPNRPPIPAPAVQLLLTTAELVTARQAGQAQPAKIALAAAQAVDLASFGPANAVAALLALCALDEVDMAFEVARGYYLGEGGQATPLRWNARDPAITDQHRRVTQPLFIPAAQALRADPRFLKLCADVGLADYWKTFDLVPDFLALPKAS